MVAYSFNKMFVPQVEGLTKLHTVRANRKRHARPGEAVQLYTAMRTKYCRKLVTPDPICTRIEDIRLEIGEIATPDGRTGYIDGIEINGHALDRDDIEAFAVADGFKPVRLARALFKPGLGFPDWMTARMLMGDFWLVTHGLGAWQGVVIHWTPEVSDG